MLYITDFFVYVEWTEVTESSAEKPKDEKPPKEKPKEENIVEEKLSEGSVGRGNGFIHLNCF